MLSWGPLLRGYAHNDRRVLRGGSCDDLARVVRCAVRVGFYPDYRFDYFGFRVVVVPL